MCNSGQLHVILKILNSFVFRNDCVSALCVYCCVKYWLIVIITQEIYSVLASNIFCRLPFKFSRDHGRTIFPIRNVVPFGRNWQHRDVRIINPPSRNLRTKFNVNIGNIIDLRFMNLFSWQIQNINNKSIIEHFCNWTSPVFIYPVLYVNSKTRAQLLVYRISR